MKLDSQPRWLIVNGDFTRRGGQELANHALATRLADRGRPLTLVAHQVDSVLASRPNVRAVLVGLPLRSYYLGERALERAATREFLASHGTGRTVFVGNGGNCPHATVSWVHFVHAAWSGELPAAPPHARAFHWLRKKDANRRERRAFATAKLVVANSDRTASDLHDLIEVPRERIIRIWFGAAHGPKGLRRPRNSDPPSLVFIGALGWDRRKGLDVALRAFAELVRDPSFHHRLVVAGAGTERPWRTLARDLGIEGRVDFRAFVEDVSQLLASADLLLCPTRYEPYGLAIQEGIMAGVPPLVSNGVAGIVDRFPDTLEELLIDDFENHLEWAGRVRSCLGQLESLRARTTSAAALFAQRSWEDFADEFIETVEDRLGLAAGQHREGLRGAGE